MFEQLGSAIPWPFLTVLIFWIRMLFLGFGLFSSPNPTVTVALLVGSLYGRMCDLPYPKPAEPEPISLV
jgi:hypothetical protein